ncbi:MAG TPA: FtsX-like permease family protein, partial [Thermomicrobiaceae bacterium]|nr:FtsX-like permease family protein [Thermomicrobiaceae bacterium]
LAEDVFFGGLGRPQSEVTWRIYPDFQKLTVAQLSGLLGNVNALSARLNQGRGPNNNVQVHSDLADILRAAQRSLLVSRSGVLVVTVQLALLAGYALLLTAGLLVDGRRVETGLLYSRGAGAGQIAFLSLLEAVLIALPAALVAPWLAALSLHVMNHIGPLAAISLPLKPEVGRASYLLALLAALGCVIALTIPARQSAQALVQARAARGRQRRQGVAQRAGIDVVLLLAAALGYWQLRRYGAPITETVQGKLGLDPFLIAAPALGLLAGAVAALRVIPLLARLVDQLAARRRGLVPALGGWQLARRPLRYTRSALLLTMAIAIGLFALAYSATWGLSQGDQANYQVGADLRVQPDQRTGIAIPALDRDPAYRQLAPVEETMPVVRDSFEISRAAGDAQLLALDSAAAPGVVRLRPDLAGGSLAELMGRLKAARPALPAIALPGQPQALALDLRITLDPLPPGTTLPRGESAPVPWLSLIVQDQHGMPFRVTVGAIKTDGTTQHVVVPLALRTDDGRVLGPGAPLSLVDIELSLQASRVIHSGTVVLSGLAASNQLDGGNGTPVALPPGADAHTFGWSMQQYGLAEAATAAAASQQPSGGAAVRFTTGRVRGNSSYPLTLKLAAPPITQTSMPALVSQSFLDKTASKVGDTLQLDLAGARRDVQIAGALRDFPTADPTQPVVVVDLPTLAILRYETDGNIPEPEEHWLAVQPGQETAVADALRAAPYFSVAVSDRLDRGETLRSDPVALGIIGALSLGFVAAALFAAVGFAVSAAVSARERLREFALLRALGLSGGQLSGWLTLESGLLIAISLVGGTILGFLLAQLILPLLSLNQQAARAMPPATVVVPWLQVAIIEASTLVVLALVVAVLALALRRLGLGGSLRLGEE